MVGSGLLDPGREGGREGRGGRGREGREGGCGGREGGREGREGEGGRDDCYTYCNMYVQYKSNDTVVQWLGR